MCGIAGLVYRHQPWTDNAALMRKMCWHMRNRGPDDEHVYTAEGVALAARRLAVQDVPGGRQPLSNREGNVWVTFNGEVYNFKELRAELEAKGYRFRTHTDTEVIVNLYDSEGENFVDRLKGMFALGLWDARKQQLMLVRDRVGKKPLFYREDVQGLVFASCVAALHEDGLSSKEVDPTAVDCFLALKYIPAPQSIYKAIRKLPAGHRLFWTSKETRIERYWQPRFLPKHTLTFEEAQDELRDRLTRAVERRLIADVPIGALLSGGLDSSIVVGLMAQLTGRVETFSMGFEDQNYSELPFARQVADHFGAQHHEAVVKTDILKIIPALLEHYGEPFGDSSAIPTYLLAELARKSVTVALNGDGGDEGFAGYGWYDFNQRFRAADLMPRSLWKPLADLSKAWAVSPLKLPRKAARYFSYASWPEGQRYADSFSYVHSNLRPFLYKPAFMQALSESPQERLGAYYNASEGDRLDRALATDYAHFLPEQLCVKMDVSTMAHSLEARSPLLDQDVIEFAAQCPSHWKRSQGQGKLLLKAAFSSLLPDNIIKRPKQGFVVPLKDWMSKPEVVDSIRHSVCSEGSFTGRYLDTGKLRRCLDEHVRGTRNWAALLWVVLVLELWAQKQG